MNKFIVYLILYFIASSFISIIFCYNQNILDSSEWYDEDEKNVSFKEGYTDFIRNIDKAITFKGKVVYALFVGTMTLLLLPTILISGICNMISNFVKNNYNFKR